MDKSELLRNVISVSKVHFPHSLKFLICGLLLLLPLIPGRHVAAEGEDPPGPDRYIMVEEKYTRYTWWLVNYESGKVACIIESDQDGLPDDEEIERSCGTEILIDWQETLACEARDDGGRTCKGYYLQLNKTTSDTREIPIQLSPAVVWITVEGCVPYLSTLKCDSPPGIILQGEEPISAYTILRLEGSIEGENFTCAPTCKVDLSPTDATGIYLRFWAFSSYGDSSEVFQAKIRVNYFEEGEDPYYTIDVISKQWRGSPRAPCMQLWDVFPPEGGLSGWLYSPATPEELSTNRTYDYLAGRLIEQGFIDAAACPDLGLLDNGYASTCGNEIAKEKVFTWQNGFDKEILEAAYEIGVPAVLFKNLIARESQFWPGSSPETPESGFGQLTEMGADTALLWNRPFYEQYCPTVFDEALCDLGYPRLGDENRQKLQKALVLDVDATCETCDNGIDFLKAEKSIGTFAEILLANCAQTGMVLELNYPGISATYDDLWRFTLLYP